jgi:hypothetical protein
LSPETTAPLAPVANNGIDASNASNTLNKSTAPEGPSGAPARKPKKKSKKPNGVVAYDPTSVLDMFIDADPKEAKGPGGAKTDPLLDLVSSMAYLKSDPDKLIVRCAGAAYGCTHTWVAPRWKTRVYKHASGCSKLDDIDPTLRDRVRTAMAKESLGDRVASNPLLDSEDGQPAAKRIKETSSSLSMASATPPMASSMPTQSVQQTSIFPIQRKARIAALKDQLDLDVLKLICVGGIPPSKVDSKEWKTMWKHGNPDYEPASAAVLTESQIPNEAARIETLQLEHLRTCENLTLTFDGNTTKLPQSVYTVHVITPDRRVFLVEGDESSTESHTGEKIYEVLKRVSNFLLGMITTVLTKIQHRTHLDNDSYRAIALSSNFIRQHWQYFLRANSDQR